MILALVLTMSTTLLQYFAFNPILGIVPQLTILVLVWLSGGVPARNLAAVAAINGLLLAVLLPGPVAALAASYMLFGLIIMVYALDRPANHPYDSSLPDYASMIGLVTLGSFSVTLLPLILTVPAAYLPSAIINALLTTLVTALLATALYGSYHRWVSGGH